MQVDSENFTKYQNNFFQYLHEENVSEISKMYLDQSICPWKFYAHGGYTGKNNNLIFSTA
jgi:hypothetical protein